MMQDAKIGLIVPRGLIMLMALFLWFWLIPYSTVQAEDPPPPKTNSEPHLANIRQLTFKGKNAEAYFSFDGEKLIFQSTHDPDETSLLPCYQMYTMDLDGSNIRRVSTGMGGTTCGYYFPGERRVLFSSTQHTSPYCPPALRQTKRYRWALDNYDIFSIHVNGRDLQRMTAAPGYDAEATISPNGKTIVFTSVRDGDLDIYTMNIDGTNIKRLTNTIGYDGGAFFSPDNRRIVYRAHHPKTKEDLQTYQDLLSKNLVEPSHLEIFIMSADGSNQQQITHNGASNFAPYFHPDGQQIIFSSNLSLNTANPEKKGRPSFHLYVMTEDGSGLVQITVKGHFNSFPMFSPDGTKLVWISDRNASAPKEFNVFLADWIP